MFDEVFSYPLLGTSKVAFSKILHGQLNFIQKFNAFHYCNPYCHLHDIFWHHSHAIYHCLSLKCDIDYENVIGFDTLCHVYHIHIFQLMNL